MAKNPKPWQAAFTDRATLLPRNWQFSATFSTWHAPCKSWNEAAGKAANKVQKEHAMFKSFEAKKTFSTLVCTVLFSATCVLSAVGPAGAVEVQPVSVVSHPLA
jgi:hypothetical protein